jgi:chaperonin GroES
MNPSGILPTEFKLLVKPKPAEEVSKGGIIIPTSTKDAEKFAQTEGIVIAVSPLAFTYAKPEEWEAAKAKPPQPGQTVLYAKYAGNWVKGKDGGEYLLINDKDVGAIIEE